MSKNVYNFKSSLQYGQKQEEEFCKLFPELERLDGYIADMRIRKNSKTIELKSDSYNLDKTGNFFLEKYSYNKVLGGVWKSAENNIDYFIYQFVNNGYVYVFDTMQLLDLVQKYEREFRKVEVKNIRHTTVGYLVPRAYLEPIAMTMEDIL